MHNYLSIPGQHFEHLIEYAFAAKRARLGNFAKSCDTNNLDEILTIEPGLLHLSKREFPDDDRNIFSIPLTLQLLEELGFTLSCKGTIIHKIYNWQFSLYLLGIYGNVIIGIITTSKTLNRQFYFLNELQNSIYSFTGFELEFVNNQYNWVKSKH